MFMIHGRYIWLRIHMVFGAVYFWLVFGRSIGVHLPKMCTSTKFSIFFFWSGARIPMHARIHSGTKNFGKCNFTFSRSVTNFMKSFGKCIESFVFWKQKYPGRARKCIKFMKQIVNFTELEVLLVLYVKVCEASKMRIAALSFLSVATNTCIQTK